jgi:ribosomal protein S18 acetylase RimI-like enzyme
MRRQRELAHGRFESSLRSVIERVVDGLFAFYAVCGGSSEGARMIERDGVRAAVVPAAPERAVANGVVYRSADGLRAAYDEIAAAYDAIGAKWTVWVWPDDDASARFLEERGHVLDAQPAAMLHDLDGVERPAPEALPDWTADGDYAVVGPLNDRSYGFATDSFTRVLQRPPSGAVRVYVAHDDGEPVGCLLTSDHDGNTDIECVAVPPEARGRGISGNLLRHALVDARERGIETSTLVATQLGYPIYDKLGYRTLGRFNMWELAPPA